MKKILFALLLAALLLTMLPLAALAEEPDPAEDGESPENEEEPGNAWGIPADDVIWYGFYDEEPVAWLVLDAGQTNMGTEGVFLLTRGLVDKKQVVYIHTRRATDMWFRLFVIIEMEKLVANGEVLATA